MVTVKVAAFIRSPYFLRRPVAAIAEIDIPVRPEAEARCGAAILAAVAVLAVHRNSRRQSRYQRSVFRGTSNGTLFSDGRALLLRLERTPCAVWTAKERTARRSPDVVALRNPAGRDQVRTPALWRMEIRVSIHRHSSRSSVAPSGASGSGISFGKS